MVVYTVSITGGPLREEVEPKAGIKRTVLKTGKCEVEKSCKSCDAKIPNQLLQKLLRKLKSSPAISISHADTSMQRLNSFCSANFFKASKTLLLCQGMDLKADC